MAPQNPSNSRTRTLGVCGSYHSPVRNQAQVPIIHKRPNSYCDTSCQKLIFAVMRLIFIIPYFLGKNTKLSLPAAFASLTSDRACCLVLVIVPRAETLALLDHEQTAWRRMGLAGNITSIGNT